MKKRQSSDDGENIWETVLSEVSLATQTQQSHLLLLGNYQSGKRSLIQAINQHVLRDKRKELFSSFTGLDYGYIHVRDTVDMEMEDNLSLLNTWILEDIKQKDLLLQSMVASYFPNLICCISLDLGRPFNIMDILHEWIDLLMELTAKFIPQLKMDVQDEMRKKVVMGIKGYQVPVLDDEGRVIRKAIEGKEELVEDIELGEGVLKVNVGIPIIILCTKSDIVKASEKLMYDDINLDILQKELRTVALSYGASLVYTSAKHNFNLELLYHYFMHRIYNFEFRYKPILDEKHKIFLPSGFDSIDMINELAKEGKKPLEQIFIQPASVHENKEPEEFCEEFSTELQNYRLRVASKSKAPVRGDIKTFILEQMKKGKK